MIHREEMPHGLKKNDCKYKRVNNGMELRKSGLDRESMKFVLPFL